jgi:hypothetical protein
MPTAERNKGCARTGKMLTCTSGPIKTPLQPPWMPLRFKGRTIFLYVRIGLWDRYILIIFHIYSFEQSPVKSR